MENLGMNTGFMGMSPEKLARYSREYTRINPYGNMDSRRKRRRIVRREFVYSTQK